MEQLLSAFDFFLLAMVLFLSHFIEDLSGKVPAMMRLIASFSSGILLCYFTGSIIVSVDIGWFDEFLQERWVAILFSTVAIASMMNAINIIDGLNGLAIGTTAIILSGVLLIGWQSADINWLTLQALFLTALLGVAIFNFPVAKLFVGDGGAYLMGGTLAWSVIMLPQVAKETSPFASLLLVIFPLYELLRTIARRLMSGHSIMKPDNQHLHSLVYKFLIIKVWLKKNMLTLSQHYLFC